MSEPNPFSTTGHRSDALDWKQPPNVPGFQVIGSEPVGDGGMGVVWRAEQERPKRMVALKVLKTWSGVADLQRAQMEAQTLASLQHANIVVLYEFGWYEAAGARRPYFAMPFIEGERLDDYVQHAKPSRDDRALLLLQVVDAIATAQRPQPPIVHRDIKPSNIRVDTSGRPIVLDFGIAEFAGADGASGGPRGISLPWSSPEQAKEWWENNGLVSQSPVQRESRLADHTLVQSEARRVSAVGPASDVYSLGVVAYQLFNHGFALPYSIDSRSAQSTLESMTQRPLSPPPLAGRRLGRVILKAMSPTIGTRRQDRYQDAATFRRDIEKALRGEFTSADPDTPLERTRAYCTLHRTPLAIALLLALGVAGTSWQAIEARRQREVAVQLAGDKSALAASEAAARLRAQGMATSTDRAMTFIDEVLFSVDAYKVQDKTLNWEYVFNAAKEKLPTVKGDPRAEAIVLRAMGRIASNGGRHAEGSAWLAQAADLWRRIADDQSLTDTQRNEESAEWGRALNWLAWAFRGEGKNAESVSSAEQAYRVVVAAFGLKHQDSLALRFDWARMRIDSGDQIGGAAEFISALALISDRSPADYVRWLIAQNHEIASASRGGRTTDAEEQLRAVLGPFLDSERPRIRGRTPWSLAQAGEKMVEKAVMLRFFFSRMTDQYGLGPADLPEIADLQETGKVAVSVAEKLATEMLPSGHPDIQKTREMRVRLLGDGAP